MLSLMGKSKLVSKALKHSKLRKYMPCCIFLL